eukprot:TRINITY_DN26533_c0_g1_i1.p1 TRINITY_DN26533_c0_g1~~TRINITY_DN26533_c0_g1_i1.p1  ORF type:complete len:303 (-),score=27.42 TRINITY_DN26533_c0_g1_i1:182-1090(-)
MEAYMMRNHRPEVLPQGLRVLLDEHSGSTRENAENVVQLLKSSESSVRHLIVMTNRFHQFRSGRVFSRAARGSFDVSVAAVAPTLSTPRHSGAAQLELGAVSASSSQSWHLATQARNAVDDSVASYWHSADGMPQWLHLELSESATTAGICGYAMRARMEACCAASDGPLDWELVGELLHERSIILHTGVDADPWSPGEQRSWRLRDIPPLRSVRLVVYRTGGRADGRRFAVLSSISLLLDCGDLEALNSSPRIDVFAPDVLAAEPSRRPKLLEPWSWQVELAFEVCREVLAIALYFVKGWL